MEGARLLPLLVLLSLACFVMANNETNPEFKKLKKSKGHIKLGDSESDLDRKLLELAAEEENTEEWRNKFKKMSQELAKKTANQDIPDKHDKHDKQHNKHSSIKQKDAAPKDKLITAVRTKLTAFSGPLSSRASDSLTSLDTKWYDLSDDSKQGALDTLGVISSNIEVFGNAGEDPVGAIRGAIDIVASIASNFGPKGQLASVALGFVSALLGLFGKGPEPKPLAQVVREQIDEALAEYREEELVRKKDGLIFAFQQTKAYLDGASESGKPLSTEEVPVATNEMQRLQSVAFMGELASEVRKMFRDNKVSDARKAIRYCEMYAQLAVFRDIILTQYIAMLPTTETWQNHLNGVISDRALFRKSSAVLLGKLYTVDYDSNIMPYFDPDVSVVTDAFSTKMLSLGKYDRSLAGLHCLMTPGSSGLEDLDWKRAEKRFKPAGNPYTTLVPHNNLNCYWKLVPHAGNTYSIINRFRCGNYDYCGAMLSWSVVDGKAYVDITRGDPVLWEIGGDEFKYIRNKQGCGARGSDWCNYYLRMKNRRIYSRIWGFRYSGSSMRKKIVGQLRPSNGQNYWKIRKARG